MVPVSAGIWAGAPPTTELPLIVQLISVAWDWVPELSRPPPAVATLSLRVQPVSRTVPRLYRPPPAVAAPSVIVSPEKEAETPGSTWNTRLSPPPLIVTPAAEPVIIVIPVLLLNS